MIRSIEIADVASFKDEPETLDDLTALNFIFGSNGTGKTTISRVIADPQWAGSCSVRWGSASQAECLVYNEDFIERNFEQSSSLKGIFTLGEEQIETRKKIEAAESEIDKLDANIQGWARTLQGKDGVGGKRQELQQLEKDFQSRCWAQKQKYDDKFSEAFSGYRGSRKKFMTKVLEEEAENQAELKPLEDLKERAEIVFGPPPSREPFLSAPDYEDLISHESNPILGKAVVGTSEVDIADMIKRLENSDWVRAGRQYFELNDGVCPFCQRKVPHGFAEDLERYFDDTFERESEAIAELDRKYRRDSDLAISATAQLAKKPSKFLDSEQIASSLELLRAKIEANLSTIEAKRKEPSRKLALDPVGDIASKITALVKKANNRIAEHNNTFENLRDEKTRLQRDVWRFVLDHELQADLENYHKRRDDVERAIASLEVRIEEAKAKQREKRREIEKLQKEIISVRPTIDDINHILRSFGFQNFELAKVTDSPSYKLVRPDGTDAKETLSEGERTFVTFLYFYHKLRGSESESAAMRDRVVVFDDPVSSLDSDILFVVSTLIRSLCNEAAEEEGRIKQVFVMTHNVYFHRQVTYGHHQRKGRYTFWMVRKDADGSHIAGYDTNPVRSSYELLWSELCDENRSNFAVQNAMRRILEHYFTHLGGMSFDDIAQEFEGDEQRICNSLISWMHAGSHYASEDLYVYVEDATIDTYLRVFKGIFEKCSQTPHYEMMMGKVSRNDHRARK